MRRSRLASDLSVAIKLALAFAFGHLAFGVLMQLSAAFGSFDKVLIALFLVLPIVVGRRTLLNSLSELLNLVTANVSVSAIDRLWKRDRVYAAFVLAVAACVIGGVLPLFVTFFGPPAVDALAYYMAQGKLIAFTGDYSPVPGYEGFQVLSYAAEMPFAVMYLFGGETVGHFAAKATIVPVVLATLALMWGTASICGLQLLGKWLVCLLPLTSSSYLLVAFDGKSDLVSNLYGVAALIPLLSVSNTNARSGAVLFGAMTGGALIAKFSLFAVLPAAFVPVLIWKFRTDWRAAVGYISVGAASLTVVLLGGWMVKNFVLFADPLVPFFRMQASTPEFPTEQMWYADQVTEWIRATYPLALTFGRYSMQYGQISVGWLLLLPCFFAVRQWKDKSSLMLLAGGLLGITAWVYFRPSILAPRYILPAISMAIFAFAYAAETVFNDRGRRKIAFLAIGTLCITGLLLAAASTYRIKLAVPYYASYVSETPRLPELRLADALKHLPVGEPILFLSYQNEYLRGDLLQNMLPGKAVGALISEKKLLWSHLDKEKIKYVVVDKSHALGRIVDMETARAHYDVERHEFGEYRYYLYELKKLE